MLSKLELKFNNHPEIYFHRQTLCKTLENRNVECITITSRNNLTQQKDNNSQTKNDLENNKDNKEKNKEIINQDNKQQ